MVIGTDNGLCRNGARFPFQYDCRPVTNLMGEGLVTELILPAKLSIVTTTRYLMWIILVKPFKKF